jgi:hypothetical protein
MKESESEFLCTDSTALLYIGYIRFPQKKQTFSEMLAYTSGWLLQNTTIYTSFDRGTVRFCVVICTDSVLAPSVTLQSSMLQSLLLHPCKHVQRDGLQHGAAGTPVCYRVSRLQAIVRPEGLS